MFIFGGKQLLPSAAPTLERCTAAFLKFSGKCINFVSNLPRTLSAFSFTSLEIPISVQSLDVSSCTMCWHWAKSTCSRQTDNMSVCPTAGGLGESEGPWLRELCSGQLTQPRVLAYANRCVADRNTGTHFRLNSCGRVEGRRREARVILRGEVGTGDESRPSYRTLQINRPSRLKLVTCFLVG